MRKASYTRVAHAAYLSRLHCPKSKLKGWSYKKIGMIFDRIVLMSGRWERSFQNCGFWVRLSYTKLPFFKFPSNFLQWLTNLHKCLSSSTGNEKGIFQVGGRSIHPTRMPFGVLLQLYRMIPRVYMFFHSNTQSWWIGFRIMAVLDQTVPFVLLLLTPEEEDSSTSVLSVK